MFVGIDLGTSSLKTILMREDGTILAQATSAYPIHSPQTGWAEQNPQDWVDAACLTLQEVIHKSSLVPTEIKAISFSGQMHGLVAIDRKGQLVRPAIIWADQRSKKEVLEVYATLGKKRLAQLTANPLAAGFMLASWLWMQANEPALCEKTRYLLLPKDYLRYVLTGEIGTEPSDASATLMFDTIHRSWQSKILSQWEIPEEILPSIHESSDISGTLLPHIAAKCSLSAGIPVVFGAGDQAAQAIGNGIIHPGILSSTIGTGGQLFTTVARPFYDPELRLHLFCHATPKQWHLESAVLSAGLALRWFKEMVLNNQFSYQQLADYAATIPAASEGLLFLPDLTGNRTPHMDPESSGAFLGLNLRHNFRYMTRAIMEGVVMEMQQGLEIIETLGVEINQIIASGGGTHHPLWLQLQADIFNRPIQYSNIKEAAAVGAAMLAATGTGHFANIAEAVDHIVELDDHITQPNQENVLIYRDWISHFKNIYRAQKSVLTPTLP
ncbi:MAG: xylulokinase [Anaerolineaceae bacterium]|nr:xylulokinase [Anaerolineaceae bacterium]